MRIVRPSVSVLWATPDPLRVIERAGRAAYKSEDQITGDSAEKFVQMLIKRGHESVIEHASASMLIVTDRGVTHEIVRHRLFSYTQESTRYCNYSGAKFDGQITVIEPPLTNKPQRDGWQTAMEEAEARYFGMIAMGASPQIARSVLPNSLKTEIVVTGNLREWRHFIKLRTSPAAHPQMREVAMMAHQRLIGVASVIFEDIKGDDAD